MPTYNWIRGCICQGGTLGGGTYLCLSHRLSYTYCYFYSFFLRVSNLCGRKWNHWASFIPVYTGYMFIDICENGLLILEPYLKHNQLSTHLISLITSRSPLIIFITGLTGNRVPNCVYEKALNVINNLIHYKEIKRPIATVWIPFIREFS